MDRKPVLSPAAEALVRRELSLMGSDPGDLDQLLAMAQAMAAAPTRAYATIASKVEAAESDSRVLLQPRPFRLSTRLSERAWRLGYGAPALQLG